MKHISEILAAAPFTGQIVLHINQSVIQKHAKIDRDTIRARRAQEAEDLVSTAEILAELRDDP